MQGSRPQRVGELLKEALAEHIRHVKDPRVQAPALVTVTAVEVSPDLRHARVSCSVVGDPDVQTAALRGLANAAGFLRGLCGRELRTKIVPQLHFVLDQGAAHTERVEAVLRELAAERAGREGGGEPAPGAPDEEEDQG